MTIHIISVSDKEIRIAMRADGRGLVGDAFVSVRPGESFSGLTFDELAALGLGRHVVAD